MGDNIEQLCIVVIFAIVSTSMVNVVNAEIIEDFGFDSHPYFLDHKGVITYYHSNLENNEIFRESTVANLFAPCYTGPIQFELTELGDTGKFFSPQINFVDSSCGGLEPPGSPITSTEEEFNLVTSDGQTLTADIRSFQTFPMASYDFEGNPNDSSGNGYDGNVVGCTGTVCYDELGVEGSAFNFDGDTWITIGDDPFDFDHNDAFSFSFWLKTTDTGTKMILSKQEGSGDYRGISIYLSNGIIKTQIMNDKQPKHKIEFSTPIIVNDNKWYHVVLTYDGTSTLDGTKIFIDGIEQTKSSTTENLDGLTILNAEELTIGARDGKLEFGGELDSLRIYNYELDNPNDIISLYNFEDDFTTDKLNDSSGNENTGTIIGCTGTECYVDPSIEGRGFDFDGSTFITLDNKDNFDFDRTDSYSFAAWINPDLTGTKNIFDKRDATDGGYVFYLDSNRPAFFTSTDSENRLSIRADSALLNGQWQHVAITYDGSSTPGGVVMYIDGLPVGTTTVHNKMNSGDTLNEAIPIVGAKFDFTRKVVGQIDTLRIYKGVLSANQVYQLSGSTFTDSVEITNILEDVLEYGDRNQSTSKAICENDADLDAICDEWEVPGSDRLAIEFPAGAPSYTFDILDCDYYQEKGANCVGPDLKDIFIELDWMEGHPLQPDDPNDPDDRSVKEMIKDAFWNAPLDSECSGCPGPIRIHFQDEEMIPHHDLVDYQNADIDIESIKGKYFGSPCERGLDPCTDIFDWEQTGWEAKKQAFHYFLSVHEIVGDPSPSGVAEIWGNDGMIADGGWPEKIASKDYQAGTLMHEIGHNLNLQHGGDEGDPFNCKPNYLSVMSYSKQLPILDPQRPLDFSRKALNTLTEANLDEAAGVTSYSPSPEQRMIFGPDTPNKLPFTGGSVNWDQLGEADDFPQVNINYLTTEGCTNLDGTQSLTGFNDWENILFDFKPSGTHWADGRASFNSDREWAGGKGEMTYEKAQSQFITKAKSLHHAIQELPSSAFVDTKSASDTKSKYKVKFAEIINSIKDDDYSTSEEKLKEIKKSFDGKEEDKIHHKIAQEEYLIGGVDENLKSHEIYFNIEYNDRHPDPKEPCGPGTKLINGVCGPIDPLCDDGTELIDGKCTVHDSACGDGTSLDHGICVPTRESCPWGTTFVDNVCKPIIDFGILVGVIVALLVIIGFFLKKLVAKQN